jgi:hypothetical protein
MPRVAGSLLAVLALFVAHTPAADPAPLAGNYKVLLPFAGDGPFWLLKLESKEGKLAASLLGSDESRDGLGEAKFEDFQATADSLRFTFKLPMGVELKFVFKPTKDKDGKLLGNATINDQVIPAVLEPTKIADLKQGTLLKETLAKNEGGADVLRSCLVLISRAETDKASADDVKAWAERAVKAAEPYGDLMVRDMLTRVVDRLGSKETYAKVAVPFAERLVKMIDAKDPVPMQKKLLTSAATALEKGGKADAAKAVRERNDKLAYVTATPYAGRKGKSDRVVLAELFSNVQSPEAAAAELALDALVKNYKPSEVILLSHHLNQPSPDPLNSPDASARKKFYNETFKAVPALYLNGKQVKNLAGAFEQAQERYTELTEAINPLLEKSAKAKLTLTAKRDGDKILLKSEASGLDEAGDDVRLRLVLVERMIKYADAPNKVTTFHNIVRAYPGGATAIKGKSGSKEATVDLAELRKKINEELDKLGKDDAFPSKERPLALKNLAVVAFVQNDDTQEVLQAVQVDVAE